MSRPSPLTAPQTGLTAFTDWYITEVGRCLHALLPKLATVVPSLSAAISAERGTVYLLGNGGSSAIARTLAHLGQDLIGPGPRGTRWVGAWDPHRLAHRAGEVGFDDAAAHLLHRDGAGPRDTVVLISGSGNSRNLVEVARYCRDRDVSLITLTGRPGGALGQLDPHALRVDSTDQQVIEDTLHAAGIALVHQLADDPRVSPSVPASSEPASSEVTVRRVVARLHDAITADPAWLQHATDAVLAATATGGHVVVLAPEGGGLGLSVEHLAHNLRWDLNHDDQGTQLRIVDGTTLSDETGMANDTGVPGLPALRLLDDLTERDAVLLFAADADHPTVECLRATAAARGARVLICAETCTPSPVETLWRTPLSYPLGALTAQVTGHLLLRGLRASSSQQPWGGDVGGRVLDRWSAIAPQNRRNPS